jgi:hypothetical protein
MSADERILDNIYVQVTATFEPTGRTKSVVVLVPRKAIDEYKSKIVARKIDDQSIAKELAGPMASYIFTHRSSLGSFKVAYSFSDVAPPEIGREEPELTRGDLKAWLL